MRSRLPAADITKQRDVAVNVDVRVDVVFALRLQCYFDLLWQSLRRGGRRQ